LHAMALVIFAAAELIDRAEYYDGLEVTSPELLLHEELACRPQAL